MTVEDILKILREKSDIDLKQLYTAIQLRQMATQLMGYNPSKSCTKQDLIDLMRSSERAVVRSKTIRKISHGSY